MTQNSIIIDTEQKIENQQKEQKYQDNQKDYNYYNNIITTQGRACSDLPGDEVMEKITESYHANIGPMITQAAANIIENALRAGMEPSTVILAIEETGLAATPSPYYLRAVLKNWAEWGVVSSRARETWKRTNGVPWWKR